MKFKKIDSFVVAKITNALHYCPGGILIGPSAEVQMTPTPEQQIFAERRPISGLFAAGECTGNSIVVTRIYCLSKAHFNIILSGEYHVYVRS